MNVSKKIISACLSACLLVSSPSVIMASDNTMYENSDFIETEQPTLSAETKTLISLYQKQPSEENYLNLRDMVIENYNAVLDRKEAKLEELLAETADKPGGDAIVAEMEEIVQEMYLTYWNRINSSMLRFTDTRLLSWHIADAPRYDYIPVMGAGETIYVKRTPVTNAEYAAYIEATGAQPPENWTTGTYPRGEADFPVNFVSYNDAKAYCDWLTEQDGVNTYRLPNESEWELAAGHMPKDAAFNCGINDGRTPVDAYEGVTRGAHGAIDFWGNVWEWTSTARDKSGTILGVKGGSWQSDRTDCRTEYRDEGRKASEEYEDVGFRVIQVANGEEPSQNVELATLEAPTVHVSDTSTTSITLSWEPVTQAVEYQIFEYFEDTGLVQMLSRTSNTTITLDGLAQGSTHAYIVQPISYVEIADNVSPEYAIKASCEENGVSPTPQLPSTNFIDVAADAYYATPVAWAVEQGITVGTSDSTFSPNITCTRGQMVTFLWRACGSPAPTGTNPFSDVLTGTYYYDAVLWAVENGLTAGTSATTFSPDDTISRWQAVTFLFRHAGSPQATESNSFVDISSDAPYQDAINWAVAEAVTSGTSTTTFSPNASCSRAQIVSFLYNAQ